METININDIIEEVDTLSYRICETIQHFKENSIPYPNKTPDGCKLCTQQFGGSRNVERGIPCEVCNETFCIKDIDISYLCQLLGLDLNKNDILQPYERFKFEL
eukprot:46801_1